MAASTKANYIIPEILTNVVKGVFSGQNAFIDSALVANGLVNINDSFDESDKNKIGNEVTVPYFGTIGEFEDRTDGTPATPKALAATNEKSAIAMATLGFEITRWANNNGSTPGRTPEQEAAEQIRVAARRKMDSAIIAKAAATGALLNDVYSATAPRKLDRDLIIDSGVQWGDDGEKVGDNVVLLCHSKAANDLDKQTDASGRALGRETAAANKKMIVSDSLPLTGSSMSAVTATGTTPPTVTLAGTPLGPYKLRIDVVTGGASDSTATVRFSTDGGQNWSGTYAIPTGGGALALDDSFTATATPITGAKSVDSIVGKNGRTGITATFANGTYNADNLYSATAVLKATSLLVRPGALTFWYNRAALEFLPDSDPSNDSKLGWMHLYYVAHRYRRHPDGTLPGVIRLVHNVSPVV
jgi:hypothetical protein